MCLGVPGRVVEVVEPGCWAIVDLLGTCRRVNTALVGEVAPGDYLMVHVGYAIERLDAQQAAESLRAWEAMCGAGGAEEVPGPGPGPALA